MLQFIGTNGRTNMQELMGRFDLSRASINRHIKDINMLLISNPSTISYKINQDQLFNYYIESTNEMDITYLFFTFQNYLIKKSLQFQTILYIYNSSSVTISNLSSYLFVTKNSCYRIIAQLNQSLSPFKVTVSTKNDRVSFEGSEKSLRFMYWYIFVITCQSLEWPFQHTSLDFIHSSYSGYREKFLPSKSLSTTIRVDFFLAIQYARISKGQYVQDFGPISTSIIQTFMDVNDITEHIMHFPIGTKIIKHAHNELAERQLFNLFIRVIDPKIGELSKKKEIGRRLMTLDNPVTKFHVKLNTAFINRYFKKNKEDMLPIFMYHTVLYHTSSFHHSYSQDDVINSDLLNNDELIYNKSEFSKSIVNFIETFMNTTPCDTFSLSVPAVKLIGVLHYSLFTSYYKDSIYIYIQYSKTPIGSTFIKGKLCQIFNEDSLLFTSNIEEADIIISDTIEYQQNNATKFFIDDIYSTKNWKDLYLVITEHLIQLYHI